MSPKLNRVPTRRDLLKATGAAGVVGLAGCLGDDDGDDEYAIGMVDSITGSLAPYGERNERGRQLALEDINEAGIGDGAELDVIVEDDESSNQGAVNAAQKLVNQDEVPIVIGSVGSGASMAIHNSVIADTDVVHISQNSTGAVLSTEPNLLRMSPSGAAKGAALAEMIFEDGHDSVAVTWINNDYGQSLAEVFEETFEGDIAYIEPHEPEGSSYRGEIAEMGDTDATAWLFITYADEVTVFINEAFDQGYHEEIAYYGAESTIADEILANTEPGSQEGLTGITESAPEGQENYESYASRFEEEFGQAPTVWSAYAYDAFTVSAIAIEAADEFTGASISEVVRDVTRPSGDEVFTFEAAKEILEDGGTPDDIDYQGVSGPIDLDENGDPPGYYQVYSVQDHEYVWGDYITS